MNQRDFELLVQAAVEGDASPDDTARLETELLASPERRKQYRAAFLLDERLKRELGAGHASTGPVVNVVPVRTILRRQRMRRVLATALASAAILTALVVTMRLVLIPPPPPTLTFDVAPHTDFTVTHGNDINGKNDEARSMEPGSTVTIRQGSMKLDFGAGARAVILGPAEFSLRGPLEIAMPRGAARFHVEPQGRGFKVVTPLVSVVDLGTDFGVVADGLQHPQVHVFEGCVAADAQRGLQQHRRIDAGEAFEITGVGKFAKVGIDSGRFLTALPPDLPYLHIPFETDNSGALAVHGTHPATHTAKPRLDPRGGTLTTGRVGQAVAMPGLATPIRTDWMGIGGESPRTIAMWVKVDSSGEWRAHRSLVSWGDRRPGFSAMCELLLFSREAGQPTNLRLAFREVYFTGGSDLADGGWHHVAAVFRGNQVRPGEKIVSLYVDGKPEEIDATMSNEPEAGRVPFTLTDSESALPMLIGSADFPGVDNGFHGVMDELYIFQAALDEERIRRLADPR